TAMSEWANFRSIASTSGWSGRAGQVHNSYSHDRSPGGSSSGSGAAASACLAAATIGTETDGSIVSPATANGVVGLKPTVGLTSRRGVVPISSSQDTIGPLARSVADAAAVLTAIAGPDEGDPATAGVEVHDYSACVDGDGLRGARIGVARRLFGFSDHADKAVEAALETMRAAGAILVEIDTLVVDEELEAAEGVVLLHEFRVGLNEYLATRSSGSPRSLAEVIEFNTNNADVELQHFGQDTLEASEATGSTSDRRYLKAVDTITRLAKTEGLDRAFDAHEVDAIVAPTGAPASPIDLVNGDRHIGGSATLAATAGYPLISVPVALVAGLPVGITFMGTAWSEPVLIKLASGFEAARGPLPAPDI
ncbi:MAG: amidase, partial [Actinobacteria bacterium]|nr:amidase [Actinomycetota bacterium]